MNYHEWYRRTHLNPADPDYIPEIDPEKLAEWVEENIEDFATPEACAALDMTEEELLDDPEALTNSTYFTDHEDRYEKAYTRANPRFPDEP